MLLLEIGNGFFHIKNVKSYAINYILKIIEILILIISYGTFREQKIKRKINFFH